MQGLSKDIELAIDNCIDVLNFKVDILEVKSDDLSAIMQSKIESFSSTKEFINIWQNSINNPNEKKLTEYVKRLANAGEASIEVLRQALRKNIDPSEVDPKNHGKSSKAKPLILRAINEINKGVVELRLQLESGTIDLKAREFKRGYPEKFANQEFFPLKKYHKEWYDEETDSVMICPKGTKGEVITLNGLNIMLPKKPADISIMNSRKKVVDQYWQRIKVPEGLTPENEELYTDYILEEYRRRREGFWFYNNGKAVYLTPSHYMALQWIKMLDTGGYMDFRYAQRDMFYFTQACAVDPRCLGEIFTKSRRTGFTYQIICQMINEGTYTSNAKLGIVSKTGEDAEEAFLKLSYGIQNLPFFFLPVLKGKIDSKSELLFGKPSDQSKVAKQKRDNNTDDYLNTLFDWKNTTEGAYDGQRMFRVLVDEASKPKKPFNLITYWGRVSPTINNGGRIVGKIWVGSTINPMNQGGEEFVRLYEASYVKNRNKDTRKTTSGLYAYFLPAHHNMEYYTDKYGVCHTHVEEGQYFINAQGIKVTEGSVFHLEAVRRSKRAQSDVLYNEELRANPMTIEEAFRDELTSTLLDTERINEQLQHNKEAEIEKTLIRGNFSERDGVEGNEVIWTPTEKGRFLVSWIPPKDMQNKNMMKRNVFGHTSLHPMFDDIGCFGCDNYDQDSVSGSSLSETENGSEYNTGSKGALLGLLGTNIGDVWVLSYFSGKSIDYDFFSSKSKSID